MTISRIKKLAGVTVAAGVLVALAGCGTAPEESTGDGGGAEAVEGFVPCLVSDDGGFNDKSFNENALAGMTKATEELGVEFIQVESASANDYGPNLESVIADGCTFIVAVGYKLAPDTAAAALANPELDFALIDHTGDNDNDGKTDAPNIKPLLFDTAQAAYLGGYAAAAWSDAAGVNKVGTFGGVKIPPVTVFMDGFLGGVEKFNEDKGGAVEAFGWDVATQEGSFTNDFNANDVAKQTAQGILDQGVDVILPVGGPIYQSAGAAIQDGGLNTLMLGVDSDVALTDPDFADIILVSILKRMDTAVYDATMRAASGDFDVTPFMGTLKNDGVSLSSFGEFESQLPDGLLEEIDALTEQIKSGELEVASGGSSE